MSVGRGTTPTLRFTTSMDLRDAAVLYVTAAQREKIVLEWTRDQLEIDAGEIRIRLTQEETLKLSHELDLELQIRARFPDDSAVKSNVMKTKVEKILKEGKI